MHCSFFYGRLWLPNESRTVWPFAVRQSQSWTRLGVLRFDSMLPSGSQTKTDERLLLPQRQFTPSIIGIRNNFFRQTTYYCGGDLLRMWWWSGVEKHHTIIPYVHYHTANCILHIACFHILLAKIPVVVVPYNKTFLLLPKEITSHPSNGSPTTNITTTTTTRRITRTFTTSTTPPKADE